MYPKFSLAILKILGILTTDRGGFLKVSFLFFGRVVSSLTIMTKNPVLKYFIEAFQELRKVTWPTRNQAVILTGVVLAFTVVMAVFIGGLDYVFTLGYNELFTLFKNQ